VPDEYLGEAAYAVVKKRNERSKENIIELVKSSLGSNYVLDGVLTLKELGLSEFPVNPTFKVMRDVLQQSVLQALRSSNELS
jgi:4-coumarate--CoA ligase